MAQTAKKADYETKRTRDHDTIRRWADERSGHPALVEGTEILRIDFKEPDENLKQVSWDEFFDTFDERELDFLYQEHTRDGKVSRFNKFVTHEGQ
jgi:hypothetical protein